MKNPQLELLAQKHNLTSFGNVFYGEINGFMTTLGLQGGFKSLSICAAFNESAEAKTFIAELNNRTTKKKWAIRTLSVSKTLIEATFLDNTKDQRILDGFMQWLFYNLPNLAVGVTHCSNCGQPFGEEKAVLKQINSAVYPFHAECAQSVEVEFENKKIAMANENKNYVTGAIGAIIGAIVGSIPWIALYCLASITPDAVPIPAWFLGLLSLPIAFGAKLGYELLGGKISKVKTVMIISSTLFAVAFALFLALVIVSYGILQKENIAPTFENIMLLMQIAFNDDPSVFIIDLVFALGFSFVGIVAVFSRMKSERLAAAPEISDVI